MNPRQMIAPSTLPIFKWKGDLELLPPMDKYHSIDIKDVFR
jgi:hypothetical protein